MAYQTQPGTVSHAIMQHLRELGPGIKLRIPELAERLDRSYQDVRDGLHPLRTQGLVLTELGEERGKPLYISLAPERYFAAPEPGNDEMEDLPVVQRMVSMWPFKSAEPPAIKPEEAAAAPGPGPGSAPGPEAALPPPPEPGPTQERTLRFTVEVKDKPEMPFRAALWSDGQLQLEKGSSEMVLTTDETRELLSYLERISVEA